MPRKSPVKPIKAADSQTPDVEIAVAGARPRRRRETTDGPLDVAGSGAGQRARIPRISRLMALAIKFDEMTTRGEVRDYADLARLGYVTRARITQIMNLLHLAPDLQEDVLFLDEASGHKVVERELRPILVEADWGRQRHFWRLTGEKARVKTPATSLRVLT
jgi:hypothetical protein